MPKKPDRAPDATVTEPTQPNQAILYRLCSDNNPLHISPSQAATGGFERPILHGLCFFGFASRAILSSFCGNDVTKFKKVAVRFTSHVFPGETLITEMWREGNTVVFTQKTAERGKICISGYAEVDGEAPRL
jgi:acyl dehydratase